MLSRFFLWSIILLPSFALGVTPDSVAPDATVANDWRGVLYYGGWSLVAFGALAAGSMLGKFLLERSKTVAWLRLISKLWETAMNVVAQVEVQMRPTVKSALADGRITPEEATQLRTEAKRIFMEQAKSQLELLKSRFGDELKGDTLSGWVTGFIERAFQTYRASTVAVGYSAPVPASLQILPRPQ